MWMAKFLPYDIYNGFDGSEKLDEYPDGKLNHEIVINHYNYGGVYWERKLDEYKIRNTNHDYNFEEMGKIKEIVSIINRWMKTS